MNKLPITNISLWDKQRQGYNKNYNINTNNYYCEIFKFYNIENEITNEDSTFHYILKNHLLEGILILYNDDPFNLQNNSRI